MSKCEKALSLKTVEIGMKTFYLLIKVCKNIGVQFVLVKKWKLLGKLHSK